MTLREAYDRAIRQRAKLVLELAHLRQQHKALETIVVRALLAADDSKDKLWDAMLRPGHNAPCPRCDSPLAVERDEQGRVRLYDCLHCGWEDHDY